MQTPARLKYFVVVLALMLLAFIPRVTQAQQGCADPSLSTAIQAPNIFNEQQEEYLGDAIAEYTARHYRVTSDEQLTAYLRPIAARLLKHMPPTQLHVQFFLVDLADANAFEVAGGRIYISPKIVALAKNEDELAGILAHELGHLVVHQGALDMTRYLADALNVTQVTDRRDVFDKFHRWVEAEWRNPAALHHASKENADAQRTADRLAIYALAEAGYSVDSFASLFDRLVGTQGKTGNWLSDLFGATHPEGKRLRDIIKTSAAIPEGCIDREPKTSAGGFKKWQAEVVDYSGWNGQEILHGVLSKTKLTPPLRGEVRYLKFSRDGKYILAQDEGNIYVLAHQPFAPLCQIDAPDAAAAQFSPDSTQVVFHNRSLRVEAWDIAAHKRVSAHEIIEDEGCWQSNLSPDGRTLACVERNLDLDAGTSFVLYDVTTGEKVFHKTFNNPVRMNPFASLLMELDLLLREFNPAFDRGIVPQAFTPDGRYFLGVFLGGNVMLDLTSRQEVSIPRALNKHLGGDFAFLGTDRIVAVNTVNPAKSHVLAFPSGEELAEVALGRAEISTATHGDFALVHPVQDYPLGVIDLATGKSLFAYKRSALDIFDQTFVAEEGDGRLTLYDVHKREPLAQASLPGGRLGALRTAAVSPDWKWLAVSERGRGGVWNLDTGDRMYHIRGFQGAYFPSNYVLYADFPKFENTPRGIVVLSLSADQLQSHPPIEDERASQFGKFLVVTKLPDKAEGKRLARHATLEIQDVTYGKSLWSREFAKEEPAWTIDAHEQRMVIWWPASSPQAKDEMQNFPALSEMLADRKDKANASLLEVLDAQTGKILNTLAVETGLNRFGGISFDSDLDPATSGDWLAIAQGGNHVAVYSLSSGNEVGRYFGHHPVISGASGLMCLLNETGHLTLYDLRTGQDLDRWVFTGPTSLRQFSPDGKRLFVLAADQTAYVLDVSSFAPANFAKGEVKSAGASANLR